MRPDESFLQQPVRSLQTMLRVLAEQDDRYLPVIPDGIYGSSTTNAVGVFQRQHGLPVTGIADQDTWEMVVSAYEPALIRIKEAEPVEIILNPNEVLVRGQRSPYLYVAQAMLTVLSETYESVSLPGFSGILDTSTADSIASFQALSALPMTGNLDKITWKHLTHQFPLAAIRQSQQ